jgi:hypothetical protein
MNRVETDYQKKLKIKKKFQTNFRRFIRGQSTPVNIREYIGLNYLETKVLLESRMLESMTWQNYGTHWVVDHVVPFWLFDVENELDMKLLWHPDNLLPLVWKDNNHKQGDLRFSVLYLTRLKGSSYAIEKLIDRAQNELKVQDKYLVNGV